MRATGIVEKVHLSRCTSKDCPTCHNARIDAAAERAIAAVKSERERRVTDGRARLRKLAGR